MSATFGVGTPPITTNYTGNVQSFTDTTTATIKTYRDESGVTVAALPVPMVEHKVSIDVVGTATFGLTHNSSIGSGTLTVISVSQDDTNDDFPKTKIEAVAYSGTAS
jgi:uncharacterized protein (UPF0254 family)